MLQNLYRALKRRGFIPQALHDFAKRMRNWSKLQSQNERLVDDVNSLSAVVSDLKRSHGQLVRKVEELQLEINRTSPSRSQAMVDQTSRSERLG